MSEWQPIETAPRDATAILVMPKGFWMEGVPFMPSVKCWNEHIQDWASTPDEDAERWIGKPLELWHPLPPPPSLTEEKANTEASDVRPD